MKVFELHSHASNGGLVGSFCVRDDGIVDVLFDKFDFLSPLQGKNIDSPQSARFMRSLSRSSYIQLQIKGGGPLPEFDSEPEDEETLDVPHHIFWQDALRERN